MVPTHKGFTLNEELKPLINKIHALHMTKGQTGGYEMESEKI